MEILPYKAGPRLVGNDYQEIHHPRDLRLNWSIGSDPVT
jgi:hypothetical protein